MCLILWSCRLARIVVQSPFPHHHLYQSWMDYPFTEIANYQHLKIASLLCAPLSWPYPFIFFLRTDFPPSFHFHSSTASKPNQPFYYNKYYNNCVCENSVLHVNYNDTNNCYHTMCLTLDCCKDGCKKWNQSSLCRVLCWCTATNKSQVLPTLFDIVND